MRKGVEVCIKDVSAQQVSHVASCDSSLDDSDGWADRLDVVQGYEAEAEGGISIRIHSPRVASFDERYLQLKPDKETRARNPWLEEFWEHRFNCTFTAKAAGNQSALAGNASLKLCTGREDLRDKYKQDSKMGFVIKATYAMATALHNLQQRYTGRPTCHPSLSSSSRRLNLMPALDTFQWITLSSLTLNLFFKCLRNRQCGSVSGHVANQRIVTQGKLKQKFFRAESFCE